MKRQKSGRSSRAATAILAIAFATFATERSEAATSIDDAQLVATTATLLQVAPQPQSFVVTAAGTVRVKFADVGFPAPLTSISLIVTRDSTSILRLTKAGSTDFEATPGTYVVRVLGNGPSAGQVSVDVSAVADSSTLLHFSAGIAAGSSSAKLNKTSIQDKLVVAQAGAFQVTLSDRTLPSSLDSVDVLISSQDGSETFRICTPSSAPACTIGLPPVSGPIQLSALTYDLFINATAPTTTNAGLFSIDVGGASGSIYSSTVPVGVLTSDAEINFPATDSYSLTLSDLQFPAAAGAAKAIVTRGGNVLMSQSAIGSTSANIAQGKANLYTYTSTGGNAQAATTTVQVRRGSAAIYEKIRATTAGSTLRAFAFTGNIAASGTYQVRLKDFGFPVVIPQLQLIVARQGASLATLSTAGSVDAAIDAGPVVVVLADMLSNTAMGLFGVSVGVANAAPALELTQGVGDLFHTRPLTVTSAGNLDVSLADLGFPAAFTDLALAVTRGTNLVGQIFGGGKFTFAATPGDYSLNFIARAGANSGYGLFGTKVEDTPPPPTVALSANPTAVNSGGTTTVSWNASGASSCVASGAWSGTLDAVGSMSNVGPFNADSTLKLTCTGVGGTSSATANITIVAAQKNSSGGGALPLAFILLLGSVALWRRGS